MRCFYPLCTQHKVSNKKAQMLLVKRDDGLTILLYIDQKIPSFTFFAEQNLWLYKTIMMHNKSLL